MPPGRFRQWRSGVGDLRLAVGMGRAPTRVRRARAEPVDSAFDLAGGDCAVAGGGRYRPAKDWIGPAGRGAQAAETRLSPRPPDFVRALRCPAEACQKQYRADTRMTPPICPTPFTDAA